MKTCPRCETENPSKANFCIKCGASLGEEILSEDIRLRKDLEAATATIEVLKKSLASAQQKLDEVGDGEQIQLLKDEIDEKTKNIKNLKKKVSELTDALKIANVPKGKWGWIFVILFVAAVGGVFFLLKDNEDLKYSLSSMENSNSAVNDKNSELQRELEDMRLQLSETNQKLNEIVSIYPLIITDIEIANTYQGGDIETDYGNTLYSYRTMYLKPRIKYIGLLDKNLNFKIKWYDTEGKLKTGSSSPFGYSQSSSQNVYVGDDNELLLPGWGNSSYGHWGAGRYRIEIWIGNVCLKSKSFDIY